MQTLDVMTIDEVAKVLKVSRFTVINHIIKTNSIPYKKIGSMYRFRTEDVFHYLESDRKEDINDNQ